VSLRAAVPRRPRDYGKPRRWCIAFSQCIAAISGRHRPRWIHTGGIGAGAT
jgi:hypothetical protein